MSLGALAATTAALPPTEGQVRDLPLVINGRRLDAREGPKLALEYAGGTTLHMPRLTEELTAELLANDPRPISDLALQDIVAFLNRVGQNWKSEEYTRRRLYVRLLQDLLGYSETAAEVEADWIGILLSSHGRAYDLVEAELGSRFILDHWVGREEAEVRALPLGRTLHILPGNVPISAVVSLLRGLLTKNLCIAKVSSADPVTPVSLALSFLDVDPDHPVAQAVSAVYWDHEDPLGQEIGARVEGICAWGGNESLRWARTHAREDAEVICFGPKRSVAFVGRDAEPKRAARGLAHDVCVYEQRACFSVRQVFLEIPVEQFMDPLTEALEEYRELLPPARRTFDEAARAALTRQEEEFLGGSVLDGEEAAWALIAKPPETVGDHPLCRTLYLHEVDDLSEALTYLDDTVQTLTADPWERLIDLRDDITARGVSRMTELGLNNVFRVGGTHDGMQPLSRLVRLVSVERPAHVHGKGMVMGIDQTELLKAGKLRSLIL